MDAGLNQNMLVDLMLKLTLLDGVTTLGKLASQMKVSMVIMDQLFRHFRREQLCEVKGMVGNDYELTLSAAGRKLATDRYNISQYIGPAPVKLNDYCAAVREQAARHPVSRSMLQEVFFDLVLPDAMLDQIGPAILSGTTIFLYGPTGNGKTSIAERLVRIFKDYVYIPYAIEVEGQIINIYDSVVHQALQVLFFSRYAAGATAGARAADVLAFSLVHYGFSVIGMFLVGGLCVALLRRLPSEESGEEP